MIINNDSTISQDNLAFDEIDNQDLMSSIPDEDKIVSLVNKIISEFDNNSTWTKGYDSTTATKNIYGIPYNPITQTEYKGLPARRLKAAMVRHFYTDPRWITKEQFEENNFSFRDPKEEGREVIQLDYFRDTITGKRITEWQQQWERHKYGNKDYLKNHTNLDSIHKVVFNCSAIKEFEPLVIENELDVIKDKNEEIDEIIKKSDAPFYYCKTLKACYHVSSDTIKMPFPIDFDDIRIFYLTALHEIAHSTSHKDRLDRNLSVLRSSIKYGVEELRAEFSAAILGMLYGIKVSDKIIKRHSRYLNLWFHLYKLRENPLHIIEGLRGAMKIINYINKKMEMNKTNMTEDDIDRIIKNNKDLFGSLTEEQCKNGITDKRVVGPRSKKKRY
ncbi:MAG: ssDNA-binding domain-containing protein [Christensenellaceae bacterium]|jgi:antirestriction protein ArdC|nr:ssDNA-binding domain-containing protein [Christensenellaceae bacterium]